MKNTFKNMTAAMLLFTLTFFAADYSFAKSHKKTAVHKTSKKAHAKKKNSASHKNSKKAKSASHKTAKKTKVAKVSKKKNRQIASTNDGNWAHTGVKKSKAKRSSKVGSKYNN